MNMQILFEGQLLILAIIIGSVTIFLFLGEKIKISAISIELIIGMILGNFLFVGTQDDMFPSIENIFWLQFLAELGFILLMFLAGLELNILFLKKFFKKSVIIVICLFISSFLVGFAIGEFIQLQLAAAILLGIVFSGASIGIVFPLLREFGLTQKRLGQILITATMVLDIVCILIISLIEFSSVPGFNLTGLIIAIAVIVAFFLVILFGIHSFWHYVEAKTTDVKALAWEIRITFAVIMFLAVLTGYILEIEAIIGAFLAGMIMGQSKSAHQLEEKIGSIGYGFFIPIFFFVIGMKMDLHYFMSPLNIFMLIGIIAILLLIKIGGGILSSKFMKIPWRNGLIIGLFLTPSLGVGIAAAELGSDSGLFKAEIFTMLISLIIISSIIIPILTRSSAKRIIPNLISKHPSWHLHLEHDLGIYLDESYINIFEEVTVGELPQMDFIKIDLDTPIIKILEHMEQYHQMNFPVISPSNQLLGIVDFDDVKKFIIKNKLDETAGTVMRREFIFVTKDDPLSIALEKMRKFDLELLPIVEVNTLQLYGTITRDGILRFIRIKALGASITPEVSESIEGTDDT